MKDFTLEIYEAYIRAIQSSLKTFLSFEEYLKMPVKPSQFCIIRHDVDRKPQNALNMAELEANLGIKAVYYFRAKPNTFKPALIRRIANLGHEIGYHYESLSDTDGDMDKAIEDFALNLAKFREIAPIKTISMHGRPLKPYDNRDIWRIPQNHDLLLNQFNILGEVYLDIDYTDIAYINDTGRNWTSGKANRRDHVDSKVKADFPSGEVLLSYLQDQPHPKMIFQIHPERWTDQLLEWRSQQMKDKAINLVKAILK